MACSLFVAVSGSSAATTATVGKITLDELSKRGYDRSLAIGSLENAGTLGFSILPSLIMIIYGIPSDTSIGKLFIGGVIAGLMLTGSYMLYIMFMVILKPGIVPETSKKYTFKEKIQSSRELFPIFLLILVVLGGVYLDFTTPTEEATFGVLGAFILVVWFKNLTW